MTNLHGWRAADGWTVWPKRRPFRRRRSLASHLVQEAPVEAETGKDESKPALGLAIATGVSAALWAAIIAGCRILLR